MTIKTSLLTNLVRLGLMISLISLPAYAKNHAPPPLPLQKSLQQFLKTYQGRLLKLEYKHENNRPYYRVAFLDAKGLVQHLRIWEKGQESFTQASKLSFPPPANLLSLQQILQKTFGKQDVRLLEAKLKPHKTGYVYELEWVDRQGIAWEGKFDARTGRQLLRERD